MKHWQRKKPFLCLVTVENNEDYHNMNQIGCLYLEHFALDHIVQTYKLNYDELCKELKLRPSNIIHAAFSLDRSKLYGLQKLLESSV